MSTATNLYPITTAQWVANVLRSIAERLDGGTITPPTPAQIVRTQLQEAEIELLASHASLEHATHEVNMLTARIARLKGGA